MAVPKMAFGLLGVEQQDSTMTSTHIVTNACIEYVHAFVTVWVKVSLFSSSSSSSSFFLFLFSFLFPFLHCSTLNLVLPWLDQSVTQCKASDLSS